MILHITTASDWKKAEKAGEYTAASLQTEGFIHCSTVKQVVDTANLFFKDQQDLVLLCLDENKLKSECKYEVPTAEVSNNPNIGNLFPHIYGPINLSAVIKVVNFLPDKAGHFALPEEIVNQ